MDWTFRESQAFCRSVGLVTFMLIKTIYTSLLSVKGLVNLEARVMFGDKRKFQKLQFQFFSLLLTKEQPVCAGYL